MGISLFCIATRFSFVVLDSKLYPIKKVMHFGESI